MRSWKLNLNETLTENFKLKEFVHWADNSLTMSESDIQLANHLAYDHFTYENYVMYKMMANYLEIIRYAAHVDNMGSGHDFGIIITSGFRPKSWEHYRGRSGGSQHTICAVDFVVYNMSLNKRDYEYTLKAYKDLHEDEFNGGLAVKYTDDNNGAIFCHIDFGRKARWEY